MKILIISDIHGNYYAVKSVIETIPFDILVCAGDLVMDYPFPRESIDLIRKICSYICVGNNDYAVAFDVKSYENLPPKYAKYASALEKMRGMTRNLLDKKSIEYLRMLPREREFCIEGVSFYLNHTVPNLSLSYFLDPQLPQEEVENFYKDIQADIIITGHTHTAYVREFNNRILVNPGSVGQPRDGDPRASLALFDSRTRGVELIRLEYDMTETIIRLKELGFPEYSLYCLKTGHLPDDPVDCFKKGNQWRGF